MCKTVGVLPVVGLFAVFSFAGCGGGGPSGPAEKLVPVKGVVKVGGKPLAGISVRFIPTEKTKNSRGGTGLTDDDGEFMMRNYQFKSGVPAGEYTAIFSMSDGGGAPKMLNDHPIPFKSFVETIPPKWSDPQKAGSHNKVTVPEDGIKDLSFKISVN